MNLKAKYSVLIILLSILTGCGSEDKPLNDPVEIEDSTGNTGATNDTGSTNDSEVIPTGSPDITINSFSFSEGTIDSRNEYISYINATFELSNIGDGDILEQRQYVELGVYLSDDEIITYEDTRFIWTSVFSNESFKAGETHSFEKQFSFGNQIASGNYHWGIILNPGRGDHDKLILADSHYSDPLYHDNYFYEKEDALHNNTLYMGTIDVVDYQLKSCENEPTNNNTIELATELFNETPILANFCNSKPDWYKYTVPQGKETGYIGIINEVGLTEIFDAQGDLVTMINGSSFDLRITIPLNTLTPMETYTIKVSRHVMGGGSVKYRNPYFIYVDETGLLDTDGDLITDLDDDDIDGDNRPNHIDSNAFDSRYKDDKDSDLIPNELDDDIDGDGVPNDIDPHYNDPSIK